MGKLDKATTTAPYMRLKGKIDKLKADPRYNFMFSGMLVGDTMADLWQDFPPARARKTNINHDVSSMPSDITSTVVAVLEPVWCSIMPSGPAVNRNARSCSCAKRPTAIFRRTRYKATARCDHFGAYCQRRPQYGVSLGLITSAALRFGQGRPIAMRNDFVDAFEQRPRPSVSFAQPCPKARADFWMRSLHCATGDDHLRRRCPPFLSVSRSTIWKKTTPGIRRSLVQRTLERSGGEEEILERMLSGDGGARGGNAGDYWGDSRRYAPPAPRGPNKAVPMRTWVAPSVMAVAKSTGHAHAQLR